jgi:hypothetical protein
MSPSVRRAILWAWLACGCLDLTSAIVITVASGGKALRVLQGIAASVIGPQSFEMGAATAILGFAMHFLVALSATLVFYLASRRWPAMLERPVLSGILFGVFWLLVMYRGVIPVISALRPLYIPNAPKRPFPEIWPVPLLVHVTCVGLPISLAISRFAPRRTKGRT